MVAGSAEHSINFCYGVSPSLQKPSAIFLALGSSASSFFLCGLVSTQRLSLGTGFWELLGASESCFHSILSLGLTPQRSCTQPLNPKP